MTEWERTAERDPDHRDRATAGNRLGMYADEPLACLSCRVGDCTDCDEFCPCAEARQDIDQERRRELQADIRRDL